MGSNKSKIIDNLTSLYDKAKTSQQNNDDKQALSYYTQALDQIESTDNATQDIYQLQFDILYNICQIRISKRQYNLTVANELIEKALQVADTLQQQDKIAKCLDTRGYIKNLQGDYTSALLDHNKSLQIKLKIDQNEGLDIAHSYYNIGMVYDDQGKYDDAISMYEKSLKINLSALGDNHPSIANTYHNMGLVYQHQGKYDDAILFYEKSISIYVDAHLQNHPKLIKWYNNIANCYDQQNRHDQATEMRSKSDNIRSSLKQNDTTNQITTTTNNQLPGIRNTSVIVF